MRIARNRLWRAAADARAQLGESSLRRDGEQYQLNRNEVSVDVDRLEHLLGQLNRSADANEQLPLLEQTLALFSGEPLSGSDFPWVENEQRRLSGIRLDLFERSGRALLASGDPAGALSRAEEGLGSAIACGMNASKCSRRTSAEPRTSGCRSSRNAHRRSSELCLCREVA